MALDDIAISKASPVSRHERRQAQAYARKGARWFRFIHRTTMRYQDMFTGGKRGADRAFQAIAVAAGERIEEWLRVELSPKTGEVLGLGDFDTPNPPVLRAPTGQGPVSTIRVETSVSTGDVTAG
jgi:hypothetical protein